MEHLKAAKCVMRYIIGTLKCGLKYKKNAFFELIGYFDSDYVGDHLDRKSTMLEIIWSVFFLGENLITRTS